MKTAHGLVLLFCWFALVADAAPPDPCRPQRNSYDDLFRRQQWSALDTAIAEFRREVDAGRCSDGTLYESMLFAGNGDPALTKRFDAWVAARPESAMALAARGRHWQQIAMHTRGTRFSAETPALQLQTMRTPNLQARADLERALALDPSSTITHAWLVEQASGRDEIQSRTDAGLQIAPHSYAIRWAHAPKQTPKWGGSMAAVTAAADDARKYEDQDPRLKAFRAFPDYVAADRHYMNEDYAEVLRQIDIALDKGDLNYAHRLRAIALTQLRRFNEAEHELSILEERQFWPAWVLAARASIQVEQRNLVSAVNYYRQSLAADYDPDVAPKLADLLDYQGQFDQALSVRDSALAKYPNQIALMTSRIQSLYRLKRHSEALTAAQSVLDIEPGNPMAWFFGGSAHEQLGDLTTALKWIEHAAKLSPQWSYAHFEVGRFYERKLSNDQQALENYRRAVQTSAHPEALILLARACAANRLGHQDESLEALQAAWPGCLQGDCNQAPRERGDWAKRWMAGDRTGTCPAEYDPD